ncbi:hypothetical protein BO94DRAFT_612638 [Aspergillus sclerotioniger CBS 115572]|uniref:Aminoglycoside phosphotransferase domain-containing protein n=1 Tax=Aspergillus sclerotioniger CBS 115572 TaxID=1450535 RepID=A0A317X8G5_9EURO|nr:hypothetical protein BO94DRAFT_612638 [Aspergillus sclerotioniger CBS 115572]PWY93952.1 hypothetical protein BO94DRAFT_612638 [Aspergillus sclerotioniger CBS 115572]
MSRPSLPLLRGTTTLESALEEEEDMLLDLDYPEQRIDFFVSLYSRRTDIEKIAAGHLGLRSCRLGAVNEWIHGSFNVCIPIYVSDETRPRAVVRFPLPYKVGEIKNPGNVDEKLRCEAATFIWMREHCPEIPIPRLWGFGLVRGQSFSVPENVPLGKRFLWSLKRCISWLLGRPLSCRYVDHRRSTMLENGYLVMDYVGGPDLQMLSETWDRDRHHQEKRKNLFRGLSRIMLSMSQTPLPRIGSWTMDSHGVLQLSNRPLGLRLHQLENGGIPTNINRRLTYATADAYYLDSLLTIMRALLPHFSNREFREGPFFYRLTDLHPSNIFVDTDWNIKCVIDLEWACSLPAETLRPPYWLTGRSVDDLTDEHLEEFARAHEFVEVFEEEEKLVPPINDDHSYRTNLMRRGWQIGNFWYFQALDSPKGLYNLFEQHIHPIFASNTSVGSHFSRIVSDYWAADVEAVIARSSETRRMVDRDTDQTMPREDDTQKKAAAGIAAAKLAEEQRKREDRAAVTQGLTDAATMKQLSSSGYEAKA